MRKIDIFCASQASTAICMSMDQPSSSSSANVLLGGRTIDRHNPIIRDPRRTPRALPISPCTSQLPPINPKPYHLLHKSKKNSAKTKSNDQSKKTASSTRSNDQKTKKTSSKPNDDDDDDKKSSTMTKDIVRKSWAKPGDFITPPGSTRYLLGEPAFFDGLSDYDSVLGLVPSESKKTDLALNQDESTASKPSSSSSPMERPKNQVVVLKVSLHCKGCEGKVRKHLSRMEGVTSFNIDFAAKKVTIVGDVTPLGVLQSVSKIKNAQFWTSAPTPSPTVSSYTSEVKK